MLIFKVIRTICVHRIQRTCNEYLLESINNSCSQTVWLFGVHNSLLAIAVSAGQPTITLASLVESYLYLIKVSAQEQV